MDEMTLQEYLAAQNKKPKRSKYGNKKTNVDGLTFDSKVEAVRYQELRLLEVSGEISQLATHKTFTIQPAFIDQRGKKHRAITYQSDFDYLDKYQNWIVEDVKGKTAPLTTTFKIKMKMLLYTHDNIDFRIIRL